MTDLYSGHGYGPLRPPPSVQRWAALVIRVGVVDGTMVVVRPDTGGGHAGGEPGSVLVDEPARLRFRERVDSVRMAAVSLVEVVEWPPARLDAWCAWYAGPGGRTLLTQVPEASFGEPMVLVGQGDVVVRAYPI